MDRVYARGFVQRASVREDGPLTFIIATEGMKADGLDLRMSGLVLDRYRLNPVVMFGHDYYGRGSLPIGRAENVRVEGDELLADTIFDLDDEFAATVDRKYRGGFLNAVSVGFDIRGIDPKTGVVDEWELIEYSAVPVPLDPDAVVKSGRQRALAMAAAIADARDGGSTLAGADVADTVAALRELLAALDAPTTGAPEPVVDAEPEPRGLTLSAARNRLRLMELEAAV